MNDLLKQFTLAPFPPAQALGDQDIFMYQCGTLDGLVKIAPDHSALQIIAVQNSQPHNGQFLRFIETLENNARQYNIALTVSDFINLTLLEWFKRRSGWHYIEDRDTMAYDGGGDA